MAEEYARISILREPRDDEPAFAETIGRALASETGWIGYDARREEIVLGMRWRCTGIPSADALELEEQRLRWAPSYSAIPDAETETASEAEPPPKPEADAPVERRPGQPWIAVGRYDWTVGSIDDLGDSGESALCPFDTYASGFPAVTSDGALLVESIREGSGASEGEDEAMTVAWHDVDADSIEQSLTIYDGDDGFDREGYHHRCRALWTQAKARAEEANRRLAAHQWTSLTPLDIFVHDPDQFDYDPRTRRDILATPAAKRPAELTYTGSRAIVRIPGVAVLAKTQVDWWGKGDESCDYAPHVREVWGDRETGVVAVFLDHQSGGCLCYSPTRIHALRWSEQAFDAAEREVQPREELAALEPAEV